MLNTCGVCKKRPVLLTRPPPTATRPPKTVKPVETKPKQALKSLIIGDPCPPGLSPCHPQATCTPNVLASGNQCKVCGIFVTCHYYHH